MKDVSSAGHTTSTTTTTATTGSSRSHGARALAGLRTLAQGAGRHATTAHHEELNTLDEDAPPKDAEEEYERLIFSQTGRGTAAALTGRLGGGATSEATASNLSRRALTPSTTRTTGPDRYRRTDGAGEASGRRAHHTEAEAEEEAEETRAVAAAASRFSAMKLGIPASDMNATLTGGGDDMDDFRSAAGLLSFQQQTFQSSFAQASSAAEVNLNDTLGRRERAAMLLNFEAASAMTFDHTGLASDAGESGADLTSPHAFVPPSRGHGCRETGLNTTLNSTAGLGAALDELRATLRSTLHDGTSDVSATRPSDTDGTAVVPIFSAGRDALSGAATSASHNAGGGEGGGMGNTNNNHNNNHNNNRVRFAHVSTTTNASSLHSAAAPPLAGTQHGISSERGASLGALRPAGVASTRTMAALGRLYSPPTATTTTTAAAATSTQATRASAGASASAFSALAAKQAPLTSLRFEALTVDALQRRFGPFDALTTHLAQQRGVFLNEDLSVYSIRSSAVGSVFKEAGETAAAAAVTAIVANRSMNPSGTPAQATVTATTNATVPKANTASAPATALTLMYAEDLHTPETVLQEMALRRARAGQHAPAPPEATRTTQPAPPLDLDDEQAVDQWKAARQRARAAQQQLAVRQATGAGKTSADVLGEAISANARLLHEYAQRRPADEKLRNKVNQWLDRVQLVVLHDPNRAGLPHARSVATKMDGSAAAPGGLVLVEEDPSDLHEAVMRVARAEEADVQARNLLERGRLAETGGGAGAGAGAVGGSAKLPLLNRSGVGTGSRHERCPSWGDSFAGAGGDGRVGSSAAELRRTPPTRQLASLAARLNPWGFTAQELSDQEAPVFLTSTTSDPGTMAPASLQLTNGLDMVPESATIRLTTMMPKPASALTQSELTHRDNSTTTARASVRASQVAATAPGTLSPGERALLDFAMQTVFQPPYSRHLRAFVQSRACVESTEKTRTTRSGNSDSQAAGATTTAAAVVTFSSSVSEAPPASAATPAAPCQAPAFMDLVRPDTLVTTAAYDSTSAAWLRCVNEMLRSPESLSTTTTTRATIPTTETVQRPSLSTAECDSEVVSVAVLPLRLYYTVPMPAPHSPLGTAAVGTVAGPASGSPAWEVSVDLLDVVARLPLRAVEKLLELVQSRPAPDLNAATMLTGGAADQAAAPERPHSRSQSLFSTGFPSSSSLHFMDGVDKARRRRSSVTGLNVPSWCKAAWRKALAETATSAESAAVVQDGPLSVLIPVAGLAVSPSPSPSCGSLSPSARASPRSSRAASMAPTNAPGSPSQSASSPVRFTVRRSGASWSKAESTALSSTATRPDTAELCSFAFQTPLTVEQSQWRVSHALASAGMSAAQMNALAGAGDATDVAPQEEALQEIVVEEEEERHAAASSPPPRSPLPLDSALSTASTSTRTALRLSPDAERQDQPGGPHWLGAFPVAPPSRVVYLLDMRHLYVMATLAVEETEGQLLPRLQRARVQYRKQCQEALRRGSTVTKGRASVGGTAVSSRAGSSAGVDGESAADGARRSSDVAQLRLRIASAKSQRSLPTLSSRVMTTTTTAAATAAAALAPVGASSLSSASASLGEALEQWAAAQRLIAVETEFVQTVAGVYRNEVAVSHFNLHVRQFNRYQTLQRWMWSPIYRSGLRLSYHLCLLLKEQGLENLPENYVRLLHPVALFVGCMGGHREMRANLPEVLIDIVERAKRVHLPLDPIMASAFLDPVTGQDVLLDAVAACCDGTHTRREATPPYGTLAHPMRPFTGLEREAVQLAETAYAAGADAVIRPADVVSCLATEVDELSVPLKPVAFASVRFRDIESLASGVCP